MMSLISIVIPSLKRKDSLVRLLRSLGKNKKYISEIIVVEQLENNRNIYENISRELQFNLIYKYLSTASTSKAKNIGAYLALAEYILFLDDDVVAESNLAKNHLQCLLNVNIAAVCGRSITVDQKIEPCRNDVGRISRLGKFSDGYSSTIKQEIDTVIGCNASWRKSVFMELGGFDERFTGNAMREESDLSLRAKKAGYTILFEPLALVRHMREPTGGARKTEGRMQWYFDFFSNETYFFLKHFNALLLPIYLLNRTDWALKCMFGFGREVSVKSMVTPLAGVINGIQKFTAYTNDHRH